MEERNAATPYPLAWPAGWARTAEPTDSAFARGRRRRERYNARTGQHEVYWERDSLTIYSATQEVLLELDRLGAANAIISTNLRLNRDGTPTSNQRQPLDQGAAVYFHLPNDVGALEPRVLACDRWRGVEHNLHAIALHIEALRGMDRWGVGSIARAFSGFVALPEHAGGRSPREVFGFAQHESINAARIAAKFRELARKHHPDAGGDVEAWHEISEARAALEGEVSR